MFAKFEDIHPNHKSAFADGLLCGVLITVAVVSIRRSIRRLNHDDVEKVVMSESTNVAYL